MPNQTAAATNNSHGLKATMTSISCLVSRDTAIRVQPLTPAETSASAIFERSACAAASKTLTPSSE